ncbi:hypothetical protein [Leptospira weilii]|uniref:hypothetical protein n=1 Tax=Leptospira weilii TaxID=28184 RepID=UPI001F3FD0AA|nr:hypothetical protein [Leptospira weilii]
MTACKDSDLRRIVSGCEQILPETTRDALPLDETRRTEIELFVRFLYDKSISDYFLEKNHKPINTNKFQRILDKF